MRARSFQEPARARELLEINRRIEGTSARYEVAGANRDSLPTRQLADPRRAVVEDTGLDTNDTASIRLHRKACIGKNIGVRDRGDIGRSRRVHTSRIKQDERVVDKGVPTARAARHIDAVPCEMPDLAADDIDLFAGGHAHAIDAAPGAFEVEAFQHDPVGRVTGDDDAVRSGHQHTGFDVIGADGNRLRDGHGAKAAGIKHVNLARYRRF